LTTGGEGRRHAMRGERFHVKCWGGVAIGEVGRRNKKPAHEIYPGGGGKRCHWGTAKKRGEVVCRGNGE